MLAVRLRWRIGTVFGRLVVPLVWSSRATESASDERRRRARLPVDLERGTVRGDRGGLGSPEPWRQPRRRRSRQREGAGSREIGQLLGDLALTERAVERCGRGAEIDNREERRRASRCCSGTTSATRSPALTPTKPAGRAVSDRFVQLGIAKAYAALWLEHRGVAVVAGDHLQDALWRSGIRGQCRILPRYLAQIEPKAGINHRQSTDSPKSNEAVGGNSDAGSRRREEICGLRPSRHERRGSGDEVCHYVTATFLGRTLVRREAVLRDGST